MYIYIYIYIYIYSYIIYNSIYLITSANFIVGLSLGRSNEYQPITQPRTPISEDMTGDVKIRYLDRQGEEHTGYICDNEWGYDDAISFCNTKW